MKRRLDLELVGRGICRSRGEAQGFVLKGDVRVNGKVESKAGTGVCEDDEIVVENSGNKFVSRGGYKLLGAIENFKLDLKGRVCLDIGASTGGFTDCMLKHGARKVYAVDVGTGQLDWGLRNDKRVCCIEKTNIRYWDASKVTDKIEFVSIDVSFISLKKVFPKLIEILKKPYTVVALIKPQFEVGREKVGKKGVVREEKYRLEAVEEITRFVRELGFEIKGVMESPIKGPAGNIEYLILIKKEERRNEG